MSLESDYECDTSTWSDDSDRMYIDVSTTPPSSCPSSPSPSSSAVRVVTIDTVEQKTRNSLDLKSRPPSRKTRLSTEKSKCRKSTQSDDKRVESGESGQQTSSSLQLVENQNDQIQPKPRITRGKQDVFHKKIAKVGSSAASASKNAAQPARSSTRQTSNTGKGTKRKHPESTTMEGRKLRNRRINNPTSVPLRTKRRRTRSYRNSLIGIRNKTNDLTNRQLETSVSEPVEQEIELDAEIDKVLEEKAIKNNLTATNVKSIIRQVITNNMVQKMMMSILRRERKMSLTTTSTGNTNKEGHSSGAEEDDDIVGFEPKLTRAKTKELFENQSAPSLWPITPMKLVKVQPPSEAQILMTSHDLPEESECEDEEYIPTEKDLLLHSDDESSRMTPSTSEHGSPYTPRPENIPTFSIASSLRNKKIQTVEDSIQKACNEPLIFKTPPPRPKTEKRENSSIGLRTRSRLPLNDTALEDLEMQLIPPDITNDMYDFGTGESINEDYLMFLKDFSRSKIAEGNEDEEEADPEYNFMEDEEEDHDREEHRIDPAVKITKKELTELVQGLLDDFDDYHFSGGEGCEDSSTVKEQQQFAVSTAEPAEGVTLNSVNKTTQSQLDDVPVPVPEDFLVENELPSSAGNQSTSDMTVTTTSEVPKESTDLATEAKKLCPEETQLFCKESYELLLNQMTQHIQLLTQSYMFYVPRPEPGFQKIAQNAKTLIINLSDMSGIRGPGSVYSVPNLKPAIRLITDYPKKSLPSPIKKKILEETYNSLCLHSMLKIPGWVIHTICGSNVFMHGSLLPPTFTQDDPNNQLTYFTRGEDALIAQGLSCLEGDKLTLRQMASIIAKVSLVIRTPDQVFRRIRNIKFLKQPSVSSSSSMLRLTSPLAYYFKHKGLEPAPHIPGPVNNLPKSPCEQPLNCLPKSWQEIVEILNTNKRFMVKPAALFLSSKQVSTQKNRRRRKKVVPRKFRLPKEFEKFESIEKIKSVLPISAVSPMVRAKNGPMKPVKVNLNSKTKEPDSTTQDMSTTFPKHFECLSAVGPNSKAIPIYNYNGEPEVYIIVPTNLAPPEQQPVSRIFDGKENVKVPIPNPAPNLMTSTLTISRTDSHELTNQKGSNLRPVRPIQNNLTPLKKPQPPRAVDSVNSAGLLTQAVPVKLLPKSVPGSTSEQSEESSEATDDEEYNRFLESDYLPEGDSVEESDSDDPGVEDNSLQTETVDLCSSSEEDGETKNSGDNKQVQDNCSGKEENSVNENNSSGGAGRGEEFSGGGTAGSSSGGGGGRDGGDEDKDRKRKKRNSGNKASGSPKKTDDTEDETEKKQKDVNTTSPPRSSNVGKSSDFDSSGNGGRHASVKKMKKTSAHTGKMIGRRTSKYNTESAQVLLEDQSEEGDVVKDAFMDAVVLRIQQRVENEGKNPALYNAIIQAICEYDSETESTKELFLRIEDLLKDYPDLVKQLAGVMKPEDAVETGRFIEHQQSQNELRFMEFLEKWTLPCPHLKSRIMQKYATFRDDENLRDVIEPFFVHNPVMLDAFKTMFSSFYRPQSTSTDFEILDLEMEEKEENSEDPNFEVVKLPEETSVPATHTCPCSCHSNTTSIPFSTRIKHCTKCCLKFQDGKVFVHNGRIMKPVNIEFTTPEVARQIEAGSTCISCLKPRTSPSSATASTALTPKLTLEEKEIKIKHSPPGCSSSISSSTTSQPPDIKPWTREEDFIMLTVYQAEQNITSAITKLAQQDLPLRTAEEIKTRFMELTNMLHKMTESESPSVSIEGPS